MPHPLLSVITVCRNPGTRVRAALASVWNQRGADCEAVVIDGGSTDGTREWLEAQRARLGALVSEPDRGVYDAMNKGVAAARGDWVLFLGADDRLAAEDVLARATPALRSTAAGVVAGEAAFDDGRTYRFTGTAGAVRRNFIHHQAAFYRRELLVREGFNAGLRVMADYDVNLRLLRQGRSFEPLPFRVAECARGGLSDSGAWLGYREEIAVRHRHFPAWRCWLWDCASVVRCGRKKIVRSHASTRPE
jgi:glycosyltransferase involved in cell wall biosynthesis